MNCSKGAVYLLALAGSALQFTSAVSARQFTAKPYVRAIARPSRPLRQEAAAASPFTSRTDMSQSIPVSFEPNEGQATSAAQFIGRGNGITVLLEQGGIGIEMPPVGTSEQRSSHSVQINLPGAAFRWTGQEKLTGETNYFIGNDPKKWSTHVPHFARAEAFAVEKGVDIVIYPGRKGIEYDLRLAPGADASKLKLGITGAQEVRLTKEGDLLLRLGTRELRMSHPQIYEEFASNELLLRGEGQKTRPVGGGYRIEKNGTVAFRIGAHDAGATLVIDPSLSVAYSTFLGGAGNDIASSIARDSSGNIYVGGTTTSATTFPESAGTVLGPGVASGVSASQFFIAKINPAVSGPGSLVYLTFIGGSAAQSGGLISIDALGDVALTGITTSSDFPVTDGSQLTLGANDVSVSEIDPTGSVLLFSTLFGGNGAESQYSTGGIAVDATGNIWIAADTSSTNLPATESAYQTTFGGTTSDAFLAIFNPASMPALTYCTYLNTGADAQIGVGGIAVDASGNGYVAGFTSDAGNLFPAKNAFQSAYGGDPSDAFLMKINPGSQGTADLVYATLLGGSSMDRALAVTVDSGTPPNAYVTGTTQSKNFPTNGTTASYQSSLHANATANAFLTLVGQNGTTGATYLDYSTYFGGSESDAGQSVALGALNEIYVAGSAGSWDFPWKDNFQAFNGSTDAFIAKFSLAMAGTASLIYATPLGGTAPPGETVSAVGNGVATDGAGHVYIAGQTTAADFPTVVTTSGIMNGFQPVCSSCQETPSQGDGFLVEIQENATSEPSVYFSLPRIAFPPMPLGTQNAPQLIAVHNGGEAALTILNLGITGPNSSDFSLIGQAACQGQTISPGGECGMEIGFTPSIVGNETAVLSISDNAPGSPQALELVGAGQGPLAQVSPLAINFGNVPSGSVPTAGQTITVTNSGNEALSISGIGESGPDTAQFPVKSNTFTCGLTLAPSQSCSVQAFFQPQTTGTFQAQMNIVDNSGGVSNAQQIVTLTGMGVAPAPLLTISPAGLAFGSISLGATTGAQSVTLTNQGSASLNLTTIAITGPNSLDFAIVSAGTSPCPLSSGSLAPNANCTVAVQFSPQSAGTKSASLNFSDNASGSPQTVALSGTVLAPPQVQVAPSGLSFGSQSAGTASAPHTVAVTNSGTSSLSINSISITGTNASDFPQTNNCPPVLGAGSACLINVAFDPSFGSNASRAATLTIADNAPGSPQVISLAGIATQAAIAFTPASVNFGGQLAGSPSSPVTVTISDNGSGALAFSGIRTSGTNAEDFVIGANTCSSGSTQPGGTCTIQLSFSPACANAPASRIATLLLTDNVPGSPQSLSLSGTATGDFCFDPPPGATTQTVTPGQTATYSVMIYSPSGYTGSIALSCAGAPPEGTCATSVSSVTLPAQFAVTATTTGASFVTPSARPTFRLPPKFSGAERAASICSIALLLLIFVIMQFDNEQELRIAFWHNLLYVLIASIMLALAACGRASNGSSTNADPGTPAQVYQLTLTATAADGTSRNLNLTLNVQ